MKKGRIYTGVGMVLMVVGLYIQFSLNKWFVLGSIIAIVGCIVCGVSIYLPKSKGGEGIKFKITNAFGWVIFLTMVIGWNYFYEELSIITTGLGGLICLILSWTLIFYKGKNRVTEH